MKICIVIPARLASSRLPRKVILPIAGKPMVQWVYESALRVNNIGKVVVATDSEEVFDTVISFGGVAVMTSDKHQSGTDRMGEVADKMPDYDFFINMQGDEPLTETSVIQSMADYYRNGGSGIITLCEKIQEEWQLFDYNVVKLVKDLNDRVMYFSRSPIPAQRDMPFRDWLKNGNYYRHIGLYGFDRNTLKEVCSLPVSALEKTEMLEQLRWMENGYTIKSLLCHQYSIGVDTAEDLERVEKRLLDKLR